MRCNNCGWNNAPGMKACEKCGQLLNQSDNIEEENVVLKADDAEEQVIDRCEKCGYPLALDSGSCPNCGFQHRKFIPVPNEEVEPEDKKTKLEQLAATVRFMSREEKIEPEGPKDLKKEMSESQDAPAQNSSTLVIDPRQTIADISIYLDSEESTSEENLSERKEADNLVKEESPKKTQTTEPKPTVVEMVANPHQYVLDSIDITDKGEKLSSIELLSESPIPLKKGDIILIAGIRYKVL